MKRINLNDDQNVRWLQARAVERDRVMVLARAYRIALRRSRRLPLDRRGAQFSKITDRRYVQWILRQQWLIHVNIEKVTGPMPADCR